MPPAPSQFGGKEMSGRFPVLSWFCGLATGLPQKKDAIVCIRSSHAEGNTRPPGITGYIMPMLASYRSEPGRSSGTCHIYGIWSRPGRRRSQKGRWAGPHPSLAQPLPRAPAFNRQCLAFAFEGLQSVARGLAYATQTWGVEGGLRDRPVAAVARHNLWRALIEEQCVWLSCTPGCGGRYAGGPVVVVVVVIDRGSA